MILTCPECATRYQTDASHFSPEGRKVRCAKCGHVWFQAPPQPDPEPEYEPIEDTAPDAAPEPVIPQRAAYAPQAVAASSGRPAAAPRTRARWLERLGLAFGWTALVVILMVIGWSTVRFRQDIASLWPQSSSLYAAVGMHVNTRGIDFASKDARLETEDGQDVLVISGRIVNITSHELSVPPIVVSLTDADKRELYHWTFPAGVTTLGPGKSAPFRTRLSSPPPAMKHIELRFVGRAS